MKHALPILSLAVFSLLGSQALQATPSAVVEVIDYDTRPDEVDASSTAGGNYSVANPDGITTKPCGGGASSSTTPPTPPTPPNPNDSCYSRPLCNHWCTHDGKGVDGCEGRQHLPCNRVYNNPMPTRDGDYVTVRCSYYGSFVEAPVNGFCCKSVHNHEHTEKRYCPLPSN